MVDVGKVTSKITLLDNNSLLLIIHKFEIVLIDNPLKMNTESIYQHTGSIRSSNPLHLGTCMNYSQELDRLTSSYNKEHGPENISRGNYLRERWVKPSSRRLLGGTVEDAEDLTGQRTVASSDR